MRKNQHACLYKQITVKVLRSHLFQTHKNGHSDSTDVFIQSRSACLCFFSLYLNLESSLEAAGKEASKRTHDGGEAGESNAVDLERIQPYRGLWRQGRHVRQQGQTRQRDLFIHINQAILHGSYQRTKKRKQLILTHPVALSRMLGRT